LEKFSQTSVPGHFWKVRTMSWFNPAARKQDPTAAHSPFPFPCNGTGRRNGQKVKLVA